MNVQKADIEVYKAYRVKTLKVFGGIQIGIGVVCAILSIAEIIIDSIIMSQDCYNDNIYEYDIKPCYNSYWVSVRLFLAMDITCFLFSGWFILTGFFPFCMTQKRQRNWRCLKITFMVCSIVGASIFVPTIFYFGVVGAISRAEYRNDVTVLSSCIAVLGFVELVLAIIGSSLCCCCSSWEDTERSIWYISSGQHINIVGTPNTQIIQSGPEQDVSGIYPAVDMTQEVQVSTSQFAEAEPGQEVNMQSLPP